MIPEAVAPIDNAVSNEARPARKSRVGRWIYQVFMWVVLGILAYHFIDFKELWSIVSQASWSWVGAMLLASTLDRLSMAYKWCHLSKALDLKFPFREGVKGYYAASFLNYSLPTTLGGDFLRGEFMSRWVGNRQVSYAILAMEKVIGIISSLVVGAWGLSMVALMSTQPWMRAACYGLALASLLIMFGFIFSFRQSIHDLMSQIFLKIKFPKLANLSDKFFSSYRRFSQSKKILFQNFGLAMIENVFQMAIPLLAGFALGLHISPLLFFATIAITTLVRRLTILFDSWGVTEVVIVTLYSTAGLEPSRALAISLLTHAVMTFSILPGGPLLARIRLWVKET
ncbi:MAG: hypothetical protein KCHDKBKB_01487 [Elusimicrobia bacterium]|nr:hypothetical protein [Elusimicrobiota bacterium]